MAEGSKLRPDLFLRRQRLAVAGRSDDVPAGHEPWLRDARVAAGVDDDQPLGVLDRIRRDRQRHGPLAVEQDVEHAWLAAFVTRLRLARLDLHHARLDGMDRDHQFSLRIGSLPSQPAASVRTYSKKTPLGPEMSEISITVSAAATPLRSR